MKPLVDKTFLLEKFDGKGGWTYARLLIPELASQRLKVMGTIDGHTIKGYHLIPMGGGQLMLPVRAEIRKRIGKESGSKVHVVLYQDTSALETPGELQICLEDDPASLSFFNKLSESERKYYIQWIYAAKRIETRADRIAKAISKLSRGLKMYDKE